jgi:hypothetical protein
VLLLVLALALSGCRTTQQPSVEITFPTLEAFRPVFVPEDLVAEPQTDADLMHNSVRFEFLMYAWQDYAIALEQYIQAIRVHVKAPP